jgi:hypothetical protein
MPAFVGRDRFLPRARPPGSDRGRAPETMTAPVSPTRIAAGREGILISKGPRNVLASRLRLGRQVVKIVGRGIARPTRMLLQPTCHDRGHAPTAFRCPRAGRQTKRRLRRGVRPSAAKPVRMSLLSCSRSSLLNGSRLIDRTGGNPSCAEPMTAQRLQRECKTLDGSAQGKRSARPD